MKIMFGQRLDELRLGSTQPNSDRAPYCWKVGVRRGKTSVPDNSRFVERKHPWRGDWWEDRFGSDIAYV
jgi:hypothetical protein